MRAHVRRLTTADLTLVMSPSWYSGKRMVELLAADQAEDGVAEELHALVGRKAGVRPGRVGQGGPQQFGLAEPVADGLLALVQDVGFDRGEVLRHNRHDGLRARVW